MNFKDKLEDDIIKILVIGSASVGKTSFIQRYVYDKFSEEYKCTIGVDFVSKVIERHGDIPSRIKLQFWDIAGQERFPLLTRAYYRYTRGCIVMFDLTDPDSLKSALKWKRALDANTLEDVNNPVPCILVANKSDLSNQEKKVTYDQIEELCTKGNFTQWTETSVRDGTMVNETVTYLLDVVLERSPNVYIPSDYDFVDKVDLENYQAQNNERKKTCKLCR